VAAASSSRFLNPVSYRQGRPLMTRSLPYFRPEIPLHRVVSNRGAGYRAAELGLESTNKPFRATADRLGSDRAEGLYWHQTSNKRDEEACYRSRLHVRMIGY
jgi:hypothetical protein